MEDLSIILYSHSKKKNTSTHTAPVHLPSRCHAGAVEGWRHRDSHPEPEETLQGATGPRSKHGQQQSGGRVRGKSTTVYIHMYMWDTK